MTRPAVLSLLLAVGVLLAGAGARAEDGPRWRDLSAAERGVLQPLERDWSTIDAARKQKWRDVAARYPKLPAAEQQRISSRMHSWAAMTPADRGRARLNYQEARQLTPQERQARWEAYQALPPERRQQLATRPVPPVPPRDAQAAQGKSNIVPSPVDAARRKPVAPTVVQAAPGATTTLMSRRPNPPSHQQPGLPKIAAQPGFVDKSTLLPKRGAQAAATRSAAAPDDSKPVPAR